MSRMTPRRKMRPAMKKRMAASAASGVCLRKRFAEPRDQRDRRPPRRARRSGSAPPDSATMAVRGGLALTGKAPNRPDSSDADAQAEKIPVDVRRLAGKAREGTGGRRALDHDHDGDDRGKTQNLAEIVGIDVGSAEMRRRDREGADGRQPLAFKTEDHGRDRRARPARAAAPGRRGLRRSATTMTARQARPVSHGQGLVSPIAICRRGGNCPDPLGDPEKGRGLGQDDMDRDAAKKAGEYGNREQIGDPAGAEQAGAGEDQRRPSAKAGRSGRNIPAPPTGPMASSEAAKIGVMVELAPADR